jgi:phosphatidylserine decarboxylase
MRIPLTGYGMPQVAVFPALTAIVMVVFSVAASGWLPGWAILSVNAVLVATLVWALAFFRDPDRSCPRADDLLLAPADGKVTEIAVVDNAAFPGGKALRIGIFLSIFNVHINRAPCRARVDKIEYRPGRYKNALNPDSSRVNECNNIYMTRIPNPADLLIVRQVSGAIARRIVCKTSEGKVLSSGERFGMIKFGSRTELYVPSRSDVKCLVSIGQPVRAGLTVLVRYEPCQG